MIFAILFWILLFSSPRLSAPEFVVHEIIACCHHRIFIQCINNDFKIAIVQARYIHDEKVEKASVAAVVDAETNLDEETHEEGNNDEEDPRHHHFIPSSQPSVSLWDLDVKFIHELNRDNIQHPIPFNALPEWHPDHISQTQARQRFYRPKPNIPPIIPTGKNFTGSRVIEMPVYEINFMDSNTVWKQPLFPVVTSEDAESSSQYAFNYFTPHMKLRPSFRRDSNKCLSYETLMNSAHRPFTSSSTKKPNPSSHQPNFNSQWHFQDLRAYFNRRCSGRSECRLYLLRNSADHDDDLSRICQLMPEGKIIIKYICFNASSDTSHTKCNVDVQATEGFVMNPGYPDLYPGDQSCQFRLHVPQQRILLILFDISLRAHEKKECRDELRITEAQQFELLSTCGDQTSAIAVLSDTSQLNITLRPQSRLAFPKRGFLAYYRVIGCTDPRLPMNSYLAFRNSTISKIVCHVAHVFPDSLSRVRWLYCSPLDHRWLGLGGISSCSETVLPLFVLLVVFIFHGSILHLIWMQRRRLEEIENQTNMEIERMCATNEMEEGSIFSFPDSFMEDLWDHDDELEVEETDQDRTLTTITLKTDTPSSSSFARRLMEFSHYSDERQVPFLWHSSSNGRNGHVPRSTVGYINGQLLPMTFNGYFRQTAV